MKCREPRTSKEYLKKSTQDVAFIMQQASDEDIEFALEADVRVWPFFTKFLEENNIHLDPMVEGIILMKCDVFVNALCKFKKVYKVKRPYKQARKFGIDLPNTYTKTLSGVGYSYPSGHAGQSRFYAHAIMQTAGHQVSDHVRFELFNLAKRIAFSRIQLGVHYPQDIREGERLADQRFGF
tara:strand:+ start:239 stop:781 length:543 start_codon:yes stop_codon:yes gene_type:complete